VCQSYYPLTINVYDGYCSTGSCNEQCTSLPLSLTGTVASSADGAGSLPNCCTTPTTVTFPNAVTVLGGTTVQVVASPTGTCECSFDPATVNQPAAPLIVIPQTTVTGPLSATIYCTFLIP
jgi:hypothetical protein